MTLEEAFTMLWEYRYRLEGQWHTPRQLDCLRFACTEAGEALDAQLRQDPTFHRNTDRDRDYAEEIADTAMMLCTALGTAGWQDVIEEPLPEVSTEKLLHLAATATIYCMVGMFPTMKQYTILALRCCNDLVPNLGEEILARLQRKEARLRVEAQGLNRA